MRKERACRKCRYITYSNVCEVCGSKDLSEDWTGIILIFSLDSKIAKMINAKKPGKYAIRVR